MTDLTVQASYGLVVKLIVALDFIVLLTPPLHWYFGNGNAVFALSYFIGSSVLVTLSLPLLIVLVNDENMEI